MFQLRTFVASHPGRLSSCLRPLAPKPVNVAARTFCETPSNNRPTGRSDQDRAQDLMEHESYEGFFPRLSAMLGVSENKAVYDQIKSDSVVSSSEPEDEFARPLLIYSDLQHPLVLKYGFDLPDFMVGAKHGFELVLNTLMGKNFHDYISKTAKGEALSSGAVAANNLLSDTLHPELYHHKARMVEKVSTQFIYSDDNPMKMLYEDVAVSISKMSLVRLTVDVVEEEEVVGELQNSLFAVKLKKIKVQEPDASKPADGGDSTGAQTVVATPNANADARATDTPSAAVPYETSGEHEEAKTGATKPPASTETDAAEVEAIYNSDNLAAEYPVGSVIATAHAVVSAVYDSSKSSDPEMKFSELFAHHVKLRGCISGDVELEWKVVDMS